MAQVGDEILTEPQSDVGNELLTEPQIGRTSGMLALATIFATIKDEVCCEVNRELMYSHPLSLKTYFLKRPILSYLSPIYYRYGSR